MVTVVDHHLLAKALDYYERLGYTRVELPWTVPVEIARLTANVTVLESVHLGNQIFVGSAEQAFLLCDQRGLLPPGKYVALTPCARAGDDEPPFHQETFYKVELYRNDLVDERSLFEMVADVEHLVAWTLTKEQYRLERRPTLLDDGLNREIGLVQTNSLDLMLNDIEIGSYGIRENAGLQWCYGTGIAEPRFTMARANRVEKEAQRA